MAAIGSARKAFVDPRYATVRTCRNSLIPLWGSGWSFWIRDYLKLCQSTMDGGQNGLLIEYEQRGFDCSDTASAMLLDGRVYSLSATWIVSPSSHDLRV